MNFNYNQANNATYQQILAGYKAQQGEYETRTNNISAGYSQMLADNQNVGQADRVALQQQYARNAAMAQQSAVSRGLGNTSVLDSAQRGVNYDYQNSLIGLNDSLYRRQTDIQGQQLGYLGQVASQAAALKNDQLGWQANALGQQYGAEANYLSQYSLADQQTGNQLRLGQQGLANNQAMAFQQNQYDLQKMRLQAQTQESYASRYGYY